MNFGLPKVGYAYDNLNYVSVAFALYPILFHELNKTGS